MIQTAQPQLDDLHKLMSDGGLIASVDWINPLEQNIDDKAQPRILLTDDDELIRETSKDILEMNRLGVTIAADVSKAIHLIDTEMFDVLLSDLHMPGAGDGFTAISAMRHKNPNAITFLFTAYPALKEAMDAILLQADEMLVKPMPIPEMCRADSREIGYTCGEASSEYGAGGYHLGVRRSSYHLRLAFRS